jgi:hypothetical protein
MTTQEWLRRHEAAADSFERIELYPARERFNLVDWFRLFLLRRRINAMLRRAVPPIRYENASKLSPHLLRDIGMQPPM